MFNPGVSSPGRLVFSTTPDSSVLPLERMRIDHDGNVGINQQTKAGGTWTPLARLELNNPAASGKGGVRIVQADITQPALHIEGDVATEDVAYIQGNTGTNRNAEKAVLHISDNYTLQQRPTLIVNQYGKGDILVLREDADTDKQWVRVLPNSGRHDDNPDSSIVYVTGSIFHRGYANTDRVFFLSGTFESSTRGHEAGQAGSNPNILLYKDVNFYVSGNMSPNAPWSAYGGQTRGAKKYSTALFGGDVVTSGTLNVRRGTNIGKGLVVSGADGSVAQIISNGEPIIVGDLGGYQHGGFIMLQDGDGSNDGDIILAPGDDGKLLLGFGAAQARSDYGDLLIADGLRQAAGMGQTEQVLFMSGASLGAGNHSEDKAGYTGDPATYQDSNFWVSGTIGSRDNRQIGGIWDQEVRGTAVFGGDLVVSGSTHLLGGLTPLGETLSLTASMVDIGWDPPAPGEDDQGPVLRLTHYDPLVTSADTLGDIEFYGVGTAGDPGGVGAKIRAKAGSNWGVGDDFPAELQFWTAPDGGTISQRLVIDQSGLIGVGTSEPGSKLDIEDANSTQITVRHGTGGGDTTGSISFIHHASKTYPEAALVHEGGTEAFVLVNSGSGEFGSEIILKAHMGHWNEPGQKVQREQARFYPGWRNHPSNLYTPRAIFHSGAHPSATPGFEADPSSRTQMRDVNFWVSGSTSAKDNEEGGVSVFAGDLVVSGGLYVDGPVSQTDDHITLFVDNAQHRVGIGVTGSPGSKLEIMDDASTQVSVRHAAAGASGTTGSISFMVSSDSSPEAALVHEGDTDDLVLVNSGSESDIVVKAKMALEAMGTGITRDVDMVRFYPGTMPVALDMYTPRITFLSGTSGNNTVTYTDPTNENEFRDVSFWVSGSRGSSAGLDQQGTRWGGTSLFQGDLVTSGNVYLSLAEVPDGTDQYADLGGEVNFFVSGTDGSKESWIHGDTRQQGTAVFGGDLVVSGILYGGYKEDEPGSGEFINDLDIRSAVTISSGSFYFDGLTENYTDTNPYAPDGEDIVFSISGSKSRVDGLGGIGDTTNPGVSVFGGDVVISGSLYGGSAISLGHGAEFSGSIFFKEQAAAFVSQAAKEIAVYARDAGSGLKLYQNIGGTEKILGGAIKVASGTNKYEDIELIDVGSLGILTSPVSGKVYLTGTIGSPVGDGSFGDGLFTGFTSQTPIGDAIDKFNEVLKALAPPPAPDISSRAPGSLDGYAASVAADVYLSFDDSHSVSEGATAYVNVAAVGGLSSVAFANAYNAATGSASDYGQQLGAFGPTVIDIYANVSADVSQNMQGSYENYPATSFGDADQGSLSIEFNGALLAFTAESGSPTVMDLTDAGTGTGVPGAGTYTFLNTNGSGFVSVSATDSGETEAGVAMGAFKHRTARVKIAAADQRGGTGTGGGQNTLIIKHAVGGVTRVTNYVTWVNDINNNAIALSAAESVGFTGVSTMTLSGISYWDAGTVSYGGTLVNAYKNTYDKNDITFGTSNSAGAMAGSAVSGVTFTIPNKAKTDPSTDASDLIILSEAATFSADYILGGTLTADVTCTSPLKSDFTSAGDSATEILMFTDSGSPTDLYEDFIREAYRLESGSFEIENDIDAGTYDWNSATALSSAGSYSGAQVYKKRLYAPANTLNLGDFSAYGTPGAPAGNPNYSALTGLRTYYRRFRNTTALSTGFEWELNGAGTLIGSGDALGTGNDNFRLYFKLPNDGVSNTAWLSAKDAFEWHKTGQDNHRDGAYAPSTALDTVANMTNYATFGTGSISLNAYVVAKIEVDPGWTGSVSALTLDFTNNGGTGTAPGNAPMANGVDGRLETDMDGADGNLSFGSSYAITDYSAVTAAAGYESEVNVNELYTTTGPNGNYGYRIAIFDKSLAITGPVNGNVTAATGFTNDAIGYAMKLDQEVANYLEIFVNGVSEHSVTLDSTFGVGDPGFGTGYSTNSGATGTGFINFSVATAATYSDNSVPNYTYMYRTGDFNVNISDQREGWNYVQIKHTRQMSGASAVTVETNYIEWVNDSDSNALVGTGGAIGNFDTETGTPYTQSGVTYFATPRATYSVTAENVYRNIYSDSSTAVYTSESTSDVGTIQITGAGIVNTAETAGGVLPLPALDTAVANCEQQDILITSKVDFDSTTFPKVLPGATYGQAAGVTAGCGITVRHPLKADLSTPVVTKGSFLIWGGNSTSTNEYTADDFGNETYRIVSGTYASQATIPGGAWSGTVSMNDAGNPTYEDGMIIYNSYLLSPCNSEINAGDFRSVGDSGTLQAPASNPNYATGVLNKSSRAYHRYFENNTTNDVSQVTITIKGDATIISHQSTSTIGANKNIYVDVKIPGKMPTKDTAGSADLTGYQDLARSSSTSDRDLGGALVGSLVSTVDTTGAANTITFNGETLNGTISGAEQMIIRIIAHKSWTGHITDITVAY